MITVAIIIPSSSARTAFLKSTSRSAAAGVFLAAKSGFYFNIQRANGANLALQKGVIARCDSMETESLSADTLVDSRRKRTVTAFCSGISCFLEEGALSKDSSVSQLFPSARLNGRMGDGMTKGSYTNFLKKKRVFVIGIVMLLLAAGVFLAAKPPDGKKSHWSAPISG